MDRTLSRRAVPALAFLLIGATAYAESAAPVRNPDAIRSLAAEKAGTEVSVSPATGTVRFMRRPRSAAAARAPSGARTATSDQTLRNNSSAFISSHASALGLRTGAAELKLRRAYRDDLGLAHLTYTQEYAGLPVFGAVLKTHLDANGEVVAVTGTMVPDIDVSSAPSRSAAQASAAAVKFVAGPTRAKDLSARNSRLLIYREGLAKGVDGANHLAYEVEVGNGDNVREFVYVDAHSGKVIEQLTGTPDAMNRRAYDGQNLPFVPPTYPGTPFWVEGQALPTGVAEADNMIAASKDTYDFYFRGFGRDSFDGAGATMDSIFNRGYACPNASWNGIFISFCPGMTSDDVTGHEWSHAYTEYTDGLIYAWQPGALNEASSDIFGETIDRLNGRGTDTPDNARSADACTVFGGTPPPTLTISGGSAAGSYYARASVNEPPRPFTVGPTPMALASPAGACTAVTGVAGSIAIVDWTLNAAGGNECGSGTRAANALAAGATGIIFVAPPAGLLNLGASTAIASVEVTYEDGARIKGGLPASATIELGVGTDNSVRWLVGEDDTAVGLEGALRDMWTPACYGNPGKVSAPEYSCSAADNGGVHNNSGVDNHAYALMVDGGDYNGQSIRGIGLTKAAHVYFRAKTQYQGPATDFADHADALEQSCSDLVGVNLASLTTGAPSGESITADDCAQVAKSMLAVEMRSPPVQCGFQPLLAKEPPALCPAGTRYRRIYLQDVNKANPRELRDTDWRASHDGTTVDFTRRDWVIATQLPGDRRGKAFFGADPTFGTCAPGGDETAVLHLDSPTIELEDKVKSPRLAFDHWVATEAGWDGGNIKISVNRGPWQIINASDIIYNPYNATLFTAAQGNTNPIAGEPAFTGTDGGSVEGSWGQTIIDLSPYAKAKDKIRLRFDIGNDGCGGNVGWYVDDVEVFWCRDR
ncbi:MAG: M4 family metallopeptidase [Steroidobacteraceae bacterium]